MKNIEIFIPELTHSWQSSRSWFHHPRGQVQSDPSRGGDLQPVSNKFSQYIKKSKHTNLTKISICITS